jgi:hypothetical protein
MQVILTAHAAQRLNSRCGVKTTAGAQVDISSAFTHCKTYFCKVNRQVVESWALKGGRVVLIVAQANQCVLTVMTEGSVVDAVYREVDQKLH